MFSQNLINLRKIHKMSQEELADRLGVSRQTLSKWETGESLPDISRSMEIADIFDVTLDELVNFEYEDNGEIIAPPPRGKHMFGKVKVGENGQIILPAKALKIFNIKPGDNLILLGDDMQGMALIKEKGFWNLTKQAIGLKC